MHTLLLFVFWTVHKARHEKINPTTFFHSFIQLHETFVVLFNLWPFASNK